MFLNKHTYFEYFNEPNNISSLQYFYFCQTKLIHPPSKVWIDEETLSLASTVRTYYHYFFMIVAWYIDIYRKKMVLIYHYTSIPMQYTLYCDFYTPPLKKCRYYVIPSKFCVESPSVCSSVCPSICHNFVSALYLEYS